MNEKTFGGEIQWASRTLLEMIAEARGYVELFLEDLENEETGIDEPQELIEYGGYVRLMRGWRA
jgi:hypothetical protein